MPGWSLGAAALCVVEPWLNDAVGQTDAAAVAGTARRRIPQRSCALRDWHVWESSPGWGWRHGRPEVAAVSILATVLMGISRVADRSHLLDEVLGAYLLGGAWLCLLIGIATRFTPSP